jgi:hypothetical protein
MVTVVTVMLCLQLSSDVEPEDKILIIQPDFTLLYLAHLRNLGSNCQLQDVSKHLTSMGRHVLNA